MVSPLPRAITQLPSCPYTFVCGQVGGGAGEDLEKGITLKNPSHEDQRSSRLAGGGPRARPVVDEPESL